MFMFVHIIGFPHYFKMFVELPPYWPSRCCWRATRSEVTTDTFHPSQFGRNDGHQLLSGEISTWTQVYSGLRIRLIRR